MALELNESPRTGNLLILELVGIVDMGTVDQLGNKLKEILEKKYIKIVIDMKGIESFSSAGWGCLVEWKFKYDKSCGNLVLSRMSEAQQRVYELMGLEEALKNYPDIPTAVYALTGKKHGA